MCTHPYVCVCVTKSHNEFVTELAVTAAREMDTVARSNAERGASCVASKNSASRETREVYVLFLRGRHTVGGVVSIHTQKSKVSRSQWARRRQRVRCQVQRALLSLFVD